MRDALTFFGRWRGAGVFVALVLLSLSAAQPTISVGTGSAPRPASSSPTGPQHQVAAIANRIAQLAILKGRHDGSTGGSSDRPLATSGGPIDWQPQRMGHTTARIGTINFVSRPRTSALARAPPIPESAQPV